jgi:hypothetical protein
MANYEYCVLTTDDEIKEYEEGLYKAFILKNPDEWMKNNYLIIDNSRLRSKISYSSQEICAIKKDDRKIVCAASANFNKENLQFEQIGFKLPEKYKQKKFCEGLNMYNSEPYSSKTEKIMRDFFNFIYKKAIEKNLDYMFATCTEKLKIFYLIYGYEIIDELELYGKKELFLKIDIN